MILARRNTARGKASVTYLREIGPGQYFGLLFDSLSRGAILPALFVFLALYSFVNLLNPLGVERHLVPEQLRQQALQMVP